MENNYKTLTFEEYQEKILELYEDIYTIFEILDIKWWVHSGTLLGIIRHQNKMIPWDDDIDLMVTIKNWMKYKKEIETRLVEKSIYSFDFSLELSELSSFPFIKFVSKEKFYVLDKRERTKEAVSPFVDLFLSCPKNEFSNNEWKKISKKFTTKWIYNKGFDRCLHLQNSKIKKCILNLSTYPLKMFSSNKNIEAYLKRGLESEKDWNILRRFDKWSNRENSWNINNGLIETKLHNKKAYISKYYAEELIQEFGQNWKIEKKTIPHIFQDKKSFKRDIYISNFIDNIDNK